jgi:glucan biosynthesis protein
MNANEMADLMIQFDSGRVYEHSVEIANMLRKQQEEIEYWKEMFEKAMKTQEKTVELLFDGLESSLALNKAQTERQQK